MGAAFKFFRKIMDAQSALNAVSDEIGPVDMANINELTYYFVFSSGTASGAVQAETSHASAVKPTGDIPIFTGTWSPEGSPVTSGDNVVKHTSITGITNFRRARISTVLVGGTLTVYVMGR
jgi:hypothetical protein